MNSNKLLQKDLETAENTNVIPFQLKTGGKDVSGCWLLDLDLGTIFLTRVKNRTLNQNVFVLGQYEIVRKTEKSVLLYNGIDKGLAWCEPRGFCNTFDLHEIIGYVQKEEETETVD